MAAKPKKAAKKKSKQETKEKNTHNHKHDEFALEYSLSLNATQAYKKVYGTKSDDTARKNGSRLLTNADIRGKVDKFINERFAGRKIELGAKWDLEIEKLSFSRIEDFLDDNGTPDIKKMKANPGIIAQYDEIETSTVNKYGTNTSTNRRVRTNDKLKALEMLGKHLGKLTPENASQTIILRFGKEESDL
ncbi:terminase small subunit [Leptospira bandrabouensis]|uniref:terminase small subunit n=1 Tax=Leptospira bandrabouensis TaxID=2484903 RepID=UPI00223CD355|nr:terminase small subunit [Leptospira bandrabouensis]MCW7460165.1 terminase small subunit [Leptospira bandrabouensis]MCW7479318.1 terminase small subunit [Leptospira bandrabouensis]MCW7487000.1 terminase small subunit [Leptospira bandrabouensis]